MKRQVTNEQLFLMQEDLHKLAQEHPGLALLFDKKIRDFFNDRDNKMALMILNGRMLEIQAKYIERDSEGVLLREDPIEGEGPRWKFKPSAVAKNGQLLTGEEVVQAYEKEFMDFLQRSVTVNI